MSADGPSRLVFGGLLRGLDDPTPRPEGAAAARAGGGGRRGRRDADDPRPRRPCGPGDAARAPRPGLRPAPGGEGGHGDRPGMERDRRRRRRRARSRSSSGRALLHRVRTGRASSGSKTMPSRSRGTCASPPGGRADVAWSVTLDDPSLVVHGASASGRLAAADARRRSRHPDHPVAGRRARRSRRPPPDAARPSRRRVLRRRRTLVLHALRARLAVGGAPRAAGRRRDRGIHPPRPRPAAGRPRRRRDRPAAGQDPARAAQRRRSRMPGEGVLLPPLYYGTVDATLLWVCLLADAFDAGMPRAEVRALVPALRAALALDDRATATARATASSTTSTRPVTASPTRAGRTPATRSSGATARSRRDRSRCARCRATRTRPPSAAPPCSTRSARRAADALRDWAAALRDRFRSAFWVETPEGRYPAVALDAEQRPVDTLTSNIGHLIGTGILDRDEESQVAALLLGDSMSSGFGIRTMSTDAAGYWPLSYHGGSVWAHDTAIAVHGLSRAGLHDRGAAGRGRPARRRGGVRIPDAGAATPATRRRRRAAPTPYPAACRPQAWSAAAAVACAAGLGPLRAQSTFDDACRR